MSQAITFYQIDAFADAPLMGNQACVMPLQAFLPDELLQAIAAENNVAETAFIVSTGEDSWALRWFTPTIEVPLCGHATLASAHVLFNHLGFDGETIHFDTVHSGRLSVSTLPDRRLVMDFPSAPIIELDVTDDVVEALGARPVQAWGGLFYAARFETPQDVLALSPDITKLAALGLTANGLSDRGNCGCFALGGDGVDVTSRFFAPASGIDEDPATGSWHTMLARVMSETYGKDQLRCYQAFPGRGGRIDTHLKGERVELMGRAIRVIEGIFHL